MACQRFVSHVTGFATLFGVDAARGKLDQAVGILSVPLFFLLGVMIAAYLIDRPNLKGKRPHYTLVMLLTSLCLLIAALGGYLNFFGAFGSEVRLKQDYFLLIILCSASGLINGSITTSSGSSVRVTHLTGITSDLGIGLVRAWSQGKNSKPHKDELRVAKIRIGTIATFALGSTIGALMFLRYEYLGFLFPFAIACYLVAVTFKQQRLMFGNKN